MKGTLIKTEEGWFVGNAKHSELPLHPDHVKICNQYGDYSIDWDGKEVDFEIAHLWENGEVGVNGLTYAKLIHHPVDTNEMIKDDLEKLAEELWKSSPDRTGNSPYIYNLGVEHGYNKAKETLYTEEELNYKIECAVSLEYADWHRKVAETHYTEEQVREAIQLARKGLIMNKEFDIKDNKIMLLEEDSWCVHKYLDDINIPRNNGDGKQYSIVGRIKILQENYLEQMSNLETMYLSKDSKISQQETLYTEEQVRKLI